MKTMRYGVRAGFSLIELLVVVAIIGILSAVIVVQIEQTRTDARQATAVGSLQNIRAVAFALMDNNGSFGDPQEVDAPCEYGVFNDSQLQGIIEELENAYDGNVSCAIGPGGQTFALSLDSSFFNSVCISNDQQLLGSSAEGGDADPAYCQ